MNNRLLNVLVIILLISQIISGYFIYNFSLTVSNQDQDNSKNINIEELEDRIKSLETQINSEKKKKNSEALDEAEKIKFCNQTGKLASTFTNDLIAFEYDSCILGEAIETVDTTKCGTTDEPTYFIDFDNTDIKLAINQTCGIVFPEIFTEEFDMVNITLANGETDQYMKHIYPDGSIGFTLVTTSEPGITYSSINKIHKDQADEVLTAAMAVVESLVLIK